MGGAGTEGEHIISIKKRKDNKRKDKERKMDKERREREKSGRSVERKKTIDRLCWRNQEIDGSQTGECKTKQIEEKKEEDNGRKEDAA